ncbi:transposase [Streptomyces sp. NPDC047000]|uniref:IS701 family transposase n=1 Tax=Streptomyces sp. NPDC047000 TaxID=3155474 RepID=UPI00340BA5C8
MHSSRTQQAVAAAGARAVDAFADQIFGYLPRADQRRWARVYLSGLLFTEGRKSMRRLAESVSASPTAWYSLQQFINSSPWEWEPARHALTDWIEQRSSVRATTVTPVTLPKRGGHSVGVHRRFVPSAERTLNCQVGIALFISCPGANFPVDWRLFLPRQWTDDSELRQRTRIPDTEVFQPQWRHMLDLISGPAAAVSSPRTPVVADMSDATDLGELIAGLDRSRRDFVVAVHPRLLAPGENRAPADPLSRARREPDGRAVTGAVTGADSYRTWSPHTATVTRADGTFRQAHVRSILLRPTAADARQAGPDRQVYRLFAEFADGRPDSRVWLTNLVHHRLDELLEFIRCYLSSAITADCLDERFDLLDFAGRSFPAWHHHMTMASAAYAYLRLGSAGQPPEPSYAGQRSA